MLAAAGLLFQAFGTLHIDHLVAQAAATPQLPGPAQAAVLLIAGAALLKCAQLPFHGWLIQVMEAPTPVSALLAALVMSTRISIKVMLAWSTCAQMGFMLMQCGLGAWEMALLHLVAHSLYKAHAFLGAGGTVRAALLAQLTPQPRAPGPLALVLGTAVGLGLTAAAAATIGLLVPGASSPALLVPGASSPALLVPGASSPALLVPAGIVALALVPLLHARALRLGGWWLPALWLGVALAFGALFLWQSIVSVAPHGTLARRLYPWFYGGLFLDQTFSRMAFALWPVPAAATHTTPLRAADGAVDQATPRTIGASP
jgi:NAD(P)H-quinone oxidoreductase subunit 5